MWRHSSAGRRDFGNAPPRFLTSVFLFIIPFNLSLGISHSNPLFVTRTALACIRVIRPGKFLASDYNTIPQAYKTKNSLLTWTAGEDRERRNDSVGGYNRVVGDAAAVFDNSKSPLV